MIELFIMILAYINIIDATTNGEVQVDGVITNDQRQTVELWVTYKTMKVQYGYPCQSQLGCLVPTEARQLMSSNISDDDGSFTISTSSRQLQSPTYSIIVNGHEERITPIHNGLRDHAEAYSNGIMDKVEFGTMLSRNLFGSTPDDVVIPEWFRNTAGYWADKDISNAEFINAVDWLITHEIISLQ